VQAHKELLSLASPVLAGALSPELHAGSVGLWVIQVKSKLHGVPVHAAGVSNAQSATAVQRIKAKHGLPCMPPQMPGVNKATLQLILQQLYPLCPLPPLSLAVIARMLPALHQASGST
jgi:hypothetical protein